MSENENSEVLIIMQGHGSTIIKDGTFVKKNIPERFLVHYKKTSRCGKEFIISPIIQEKLMDEIINWFQYKNVSIEEDEKFKKCCSNKHIQDYKLKGTYKDANFGLALKSYQEYSSPEYCKLHICKTKYYDKTFYRFINDEGFNQSVYLFIKNPNGELIRYDLLLDDDIFILMNGEENINIEEIREFGPDTITLSGIFTILSFLQKRNIYIFDNVCSVYFENGSIVETPEILSSLETTFNEEKDIFITGGKNKKKQNKYNWTKKRKAFLVKTYNKNNKSKKYH